MVKFAVRTPPIVGGHHVTHSGTSMLRHPHSHACASFASIRLSSSFEILHAYGSFIDDYCRYHTTPPFLVSITYFVYSLSPCCLQSFYLYYDKKTRFIHSNKYLWLYKLRYLITHDRETKYSNKKNRSNKISTPTPLTPFFYLTLYKRVKLTDWIAYAHN